MTMLWSFSPTMATSERMHALEDRIPLAFEWRNRSEFVRHVASSNGKAVDAEGLSLGQIVGSRMIDAPTPCLACSDPDFAPDCLFVGELIVSARLAELLQLGPEAAQYLDVDCAACTPKMQAANYRLLNVLSFSNPIDRERSGPGVFIDIDLPDGGSTYVWLPEPPQPGGVVPRIQWRRDFVAPAPLFRVPGLSWTLATDDLAKRVMREGLDVAFYDFTNDGSRAQTIIQR